VQKLWVCREPVSTYIPKDECNYMLFFDSKPGRSKITGVWFETEDTLTLCPDVFHRIFQLRLMPGDGPIEIRTPITVSIVEDSTGKPTDNSVLLASS